MTGFLPKTLGVLSVLLLLMTAAGAADLKEVKVDRVDGRYVLTSETLMEASQEQVYAVLTNYDLFLKFSSAFTESRNVDPDEEGRPQFYNRMEGCVLMFCVSFERFGHLVLTPKSYIQAVVDPEKSDFKHSVESWELVEEDDRTLLIYKFEVEPAFWVPPLIGPFYIRRALRAGAVDAVDRIEAIAQGREPEV
jgi:hypothetical protein